MMLMLKEAKRKMMSDNQENRSEKIKRIKICLKEINKNKNKGKE